MCLCVEDKVIHVQQKVIFFGEQQKEILECFSKNIRVHSMGGGEIV